MKPTNFFLSLFVTVFQFSCITSLQPLVTYNTAISEDRLIGKWKTNDQEYHISRFFESDFYKRHKKDLEEDNKKNKTNGGQTQNDSMLLTKSYLLEYSKEGIRYEFLGSLVRLNGELFMNFTPVDMNPLVTGENSGDINYNNRLSTNSIARIQFSNVNSVRVDFLDGGYIYDQVKASHIKIKNERDDMFDTFVITASSAELQQFLEKYGRNNKFYRKENSINLTRKI